MSRPKIKISKDKLKYLYLRKKLLPAQIAEGFNCGERTVYTRLYEYKIPIRHDRKRNDITEEKLKDLYLDKKKSIGRIAEMFNCSKGTIWTKLCQYNIEAKTKSEANRGKYKIKMSESGLRDLYINKKLNTNEIARKFKCSTTTVVKRLHYFNIPIRRTRINISPKILEDLYINKKNTIYQIAKEFHCNSVTILNRLNQYNIPIWRNELRKGKYKVEIPKEEVKNLYIGKKIPVSEIKKIFSCSATTLRKRLERYGVPIRNISEALKGKPSTFKGKHHTEETRKKLSMLTVKQLASGLVKTQDTSIEKKIEEELRRNRIYYQKHVSLCGVTVPDFYLPDYKVAIYTDGDYWHNLPIVKNRDKKQNKILKQKSYQVLRFWEHEINNSLDKCINKIKEYIKFQKYV